MTYTQCCMRAATTPAALSLALAIIHQTEREARHD